MRRAWVLAGRLTGIAVSFCGDFTRVGRAVKLVSSVARMVKTVRKMRR